MAFTSGILISAGWYPIYIQRVLWTSMVSMFRDLKSRVVAVIETFSMAEIRFGSAPRGLKMQP